MARLPKYTFRVIGVLLLTAVLLLSLYFVIRYVETREEAAAQSAALPASPSAAQGDVIYYGGSAYRPKDSITTLLLIGIDEEGPVKSSNSYNNSGQADFLTLVVLDSDSETMTALQLNRDTMAQIPVLGVGGKTAGSITGQLALAHTYGSGLEDSCENTAKAVSDFLYGTVVDSYVSVNMDAVSALNDIVGGVTVRVTEDFSASDASIVKDSDITLTGSQAITYVRARSTMEDSSNIARMARQKQYFAALAEKLRAATSDSVFMAEAFAAIADYTVTDLDLNDLAELSEQFNSYTFTEIKTPSGESRMGSKFVEFYADDEALRALVIELLYEKQA